MKLIAFISFLICPMIVIDAQDCIPISCVIRARQGEKWVTGRGDTFLDPTVLSKHFIADIINDGKKIYKYKIQWFGGSWSGWKFPGENDNDWSAKSDYDNVWNQAHADAGRLEWTLFSDHNHEVCYLTPSSTGFQAKADEGMKDEQEFEHDTASASDGVTDANEKWKTIILAFLSGVACMFILIAFCFCGYIGWKKKQQIKHVHVTVDVEETDEFVMEHETNAYSENQI